MGTHEKEELEMNAPMEAKPPPEVKPCRNGLFAAKTMWLNLAASFCQAQGACGLQPRGAEPWRGLPWVERTITSLSPNPNVGSVSVVTASRSKGPEPTLGFGGKGMWCRRYPGFYEPWAMIRKPRWAWKKETHSTADIILATHLS